MATGADGSSGSGSAKVERPVLGGPRQSWLRLDAEPIPLEAEGFPALLALRKGDARPTGLVAADLDEDGVPDLVTAFATQEGGLLVVHRGNLEARGPGWGGSRRARVSPPFLPAARSLAVFPQPDLIVAGDFDGDDHQDIVVARRGTDELAWLRGNGNGTLGRPERIELPGPVTAMAAGEMNRRDGVPELVVGVGGKAPQILIYEHPQGALRAVQDPRIQAEGHRLADSPVALAIGDLDNDGWMDLAALSSDGLVVIHGRDRKLTLPRDVRDRVAPARIERHALRVRGIDLALGRFQGDDPEVAVLAAEGGVGCINPRTGAMTEMKPGIPGTRLVRARTSSRSDDDLLVIDPDRHQIVVLNARNPSGRVREVDSVPLKVGTDPVAVLPMQLNEDALEDLVLLRSGEAPLFTMSTRGIVTYVVDTTDDSNDGSCGGASGDCTLREAIIAANAHAGLDSIEFDVGSGVPKISVVGAALPDITDPVTITGSTGDADRIELDGSNLSDGSFANGLRILASGCVVRDLVINGFPNSGISWQGASGFIRGNFVGTDAAGLSKKGNKASGIVIHASNNTVGGLLDSDRNVLAGNSLAGITIMPSGTGNLITHNYVGIAASGNASLGNGDDGIYVRGANNVIGGTIALSRNIISGNSKNGIDIVGDSNLVQGNIIGLDSGGTLDRGNTLSGVRIQSSESNTIGGSTAGARNVISGNNNDGVSIAAVVARDTENNLVQGNYIGTDSQGKLDRGNTDLGVRLTARGNTVGGLSGTAGTAPGNVISGNNSSGISLDGEGTTAAVNLVLGNLIGGNAAGTSQLPNNFDGVQVSSGSGQATIGGTDSGARNVISGNSRYGILVVATGVTIRGNQIGLTLDGTTALPNGNYGISLSDANSTVVGGAQIEARNLISGNNQGGIVLVGTSTNNVIQSNLIGLADGNANAGNNGPGISINDGSGTKVGGVGGGNTIAYNTGAGVVIHKGTGHRISRNSIHDNGGLGIDLVGNDVVEINDAGDPDGGANQVQNFPEQSAAGVCNGDTLVQGSLSSKPSSAFTLEFFASSSCNAMAPKDYGEGGLFAGSLDVVTNVRGVADFTMTIPGVDASNLYVTSTATDSNGNTSEFSKCFLVAPTPNCLATPTPTSGAPSGTPTPTATGPTGTPTSTPTPGAAPVPASPASGLGTLIGLALMLGLLARPKRARQAARRGRRDE